MYTVNGEIPVAIDPCDPFDPANGRSAPVTIPVVVGVKGNALTSV